MKRAWMGIALLGIFMGWGTAPAQSREEITCIVMTTSDGDITISSSGMQLRDYELTPVTSHTGRKITFADEKRNVRAVLDMESDSLVCLTIIEGTLSMKMTTCWKNIRPLSSGEALALVPDSVRCERVRTLMRNSFFAEKLP